MMRRWRSLRRWDGNLEDTFNWKWPFLHRLEQSALPHPLSASTVSDVLIGAIPLLMVREPMPTQASFESGRVNCTSHVVRSDHPHVKTN
mmetsp:Transcript_40660/g.86598  ORF Transcript_40660/g.86598 Transcript_40660/m.86598 type:complete len:89 (-) Transcript_40660:129-395(-)